MKSPNIISAARRMTLIALALFLVLTAPLRAYAAEKETPYQEIGASHRDAEFTYELFLTDQNGMTVENPRTLSAGDTLYVEIRLVRNQFSEVTYESYGIEFRLLTRGLTYNNDGATLRGGTQVHRATYMDGDSVGFAWCDMTRAGESFANPVLAASRSYTVNDPRTVNITVPVALIYVTGEDDEFVPVGTARLFLDLNGGELIGEDVSGEYPSGKAVVLPDAKFGDYVFEGWSDGARVYPAGTEYILSGVVTLTAQWADLVRDRYLTFLPNGGQIIGEDPSGYYADGEIVVMPEAQREDHRLTGWSDGVDIYLPGDEYTIYNTVNLTAQWEAVATTEPTEPGTDGGEGCIICGRDNQLIPHLPICQQCLPIMLLLLGLCGAFLLILLLWKRSFVKYSLISGDIALNFKNKKHDVQVEVVLIDGEQEHRLNQSGIVAPKRRLRFIKNVLQLPIAEVKPGKYHGKLIITRGRVSEVRKCRIKAIDKELKEKQ